MAYISKKYLKSHFRDPKKRFFFNFVFLEVFLYAVSTYCKLQFSLTKFLYTLMDRVPSVGAWFTPTHAQKRVLLHGIIVSNKLNHNSCRRQKTATENTLFLSFNIYFVIPCRILNSNLPRKLTTQGFQHTIMPIYRYTIHAGIPNFDIPEEKIYTRLYRY